MLFPEDGCLPRITRSGLSPFNNVMIIKVPEQFRKPGETIFQLATLDPSKKTERWPADKFIYKDSVTEDLTVPNCSESDSLKEKVSKKSKFEIQVQKSLFALEKQRLKEKLSSAMSSDHDKRVSPNVKNYENHQDFKNQTARNHQDDRKSFAAKTNPDNRGFRSRDYNDGKSRHDARYNNRAQEIDPWINPPFEFINSGYDKSVKNNNLKNHTVDLLRQQSESSHFYNGDDERILNHMSDRVPVENTPEFSLPGYMMYQEQPPRNTNWQRPPKAKRGLLTTPPKLFNSHPQRNPSENPYFEPNRNIPEKTDFRTIQRRGIEPLDFNNSYNSSYDSLPDFQYGNQYPNISRPESEFAHDRNYPRNSRDEPNFLRNQSNDPNLKPMHFLSNLNEIDSYRGGDFHRPYPIPGNGLDYQGRIYEQNSSKDADFTKQGGKGFRPRKHNNRRDHRGRNPFRSSRGHRYVRGQRNDRFQKKNPD